MAVKALFWVREVTHYGNSDGMKVVLGPVTRTGDGNVHWAKYTPSGEITMFVNTESAQEWFQSRLGKDVAITFDDPEPEE